MAIPSQSRQSGTAPGVIPQARRACRDLLPRGMTSAEADNYMAVVPGFLESATESTGR